MHTHFGDPTDSCCMNLKVTVVMVVMEVMVAMEAMVVTEAKVRPQD